MTGRTFLININCSTILQNSEEALYTMLIDTSKMSIVYELVEWIRWMFSLKDCIYLMHEKSVIHELEDILLLSELKHFEIMPCVGGFCVHRKTYRILLKDLNLIVPWKDLKVHKYFLDKMSQMSPRLTQESLKTQEELSSARVQNLTSFNTETDSDNKINSEKNKSHSNENDQTESNLIKYPVNKKACTPDGSCKSVSGEESPSTKTVCFDKRAVEKENSLLQLDNTFNLSNSPRNSENKISETQKADNADLNKSISNTSPASKECTVDVQSVKHHTKRKPIKPFSIGETLSVIRKDLEGKNMENNSQISASTPDERTPEAKIFNVENLYSAQDKFIALKKRHRVRKRKKSNRQTPECKDFASCDAENKKPFFPLKISRSSCGSKPSHIRFDVDDECDNFDDANLMESESIQTPSGEYEHGNNSEGVNETTTAFFQNKSKELVSVVNGVHQNDSQKPVLCYSEKNDEYRMGCLSEPDNEITGEEMVTDAQDGYCDALSQSFCPLESFQLSHSNHELNDLLSLREKCKNGLVIHRF